ncbi:MAG: T9SS type A sorting domain-containing protein [Candidatus Eisenbacteria sp.]|nr:T9SS type A sorting domain-containing protein [Candidatus Eisenbacteria bacterium]
MKHHPGLLGGILTVLLLMGAGTAAASLSVSVQPPVSYVALGDTVEIAIHMEGPDSIGWYWVQIRVNEQVLAFLDCSTDVMDGCPNGSWCPDCGPTGDPGVVSICCACFGTHTCVGIPADVAVIRYTVTGIGISSVVFEEAHASDCDRDMIGIDSVENGLVIVAGAGVDREPPGLPSPTLFCYPNPFMNSITLEYIIPSFQKGITPAETAELRIFDCRGRQIRNLPLDFEPGEHRAVWDGLDQRGRPVPSGVYFCRIGTDRSVSIQKIMKLE